MDALRRREFLAGMAAFGAAGLMPVVRARAQESSAVRRLDLHHHFASPGWKKRMAQAKRQGWDTFQDYSPARSIESMDKAGIQTALISTSTPGLWFTDNFAAERPDAIGLAREVNEYAERSSNRLARDAARPPRPAPRRATATSRSSGHMVAAGWWR